MLVTLQLMLNEAKWRRWIDTHFVHLISPNVYRTWKEALTAFDYFTTNGNFSDFEKYVKTFSLRFINGNFTDFEKFVNL